MSTTKQIAVLNDAQHIYLTTPTTHTCISPLAFLNHTCHAGKQLTIMGPFGTNF